MRSRSESVFVLTAACVLACTEALPPGEAPPPVQVPAPDVTPPSKRPLSDPEPFEVRDDASLQRLLDAGVAAEIFRFEIAQGERPRLAGAAALLVAFAEQNAAASPEQLEGYAVAVDGVLERAYPADPNLARGPLFFPAVRFASELADPTFDGTRTRLGQRALQLLELDLDPRSRELRAVDFARAQSTDLVNHPPLAVLVTQAMLDRTPDHHLRPGLRGALRALAARNDIELTPADLEREYPEIAAARQGLPADFERFEAERRSSFAETRVAVEAELSGVGRRIDAALDSIVQSLAREPSFFDGASRSLDPVVIAEAERQRGAARRARLASRAALSLGALLIAQQASELGRTEARQLRDFAHVQLQTDRTMNDVTGVLAVGGEALSAAGAFATGNPLGGAGGLLNVVNGVLGLVGPGVPTPDEQIFDQMVALRNQVERFRREMHDRFDSIEAQLNVLYGAMVGGLDQIDRTTRRIEGNVRQISVDLYSLRSALAQLEAHLYGVLSAGFEQSFIEDMETGLAYRQRTGSDLKFAGDGGNTFFALHSRFYSRATVITANELYAGPRTTSLVNDASAADALAKDLGVNINNLRAFPNQLGLPALGTFRVPNPTAWSLAADAYAQLGRENPWYFARLHRNDPNRLSEVIGSGQSVEAVLRNARSRALIERLVDDYRGRVAALDAVLGLANYVESRGHPRRLDPFGPVERDMRGQGPPFLRLSGGDPAQAPWFDTTVGWEVLDPRYGLAAALQLPGYGPEELRLLVSFDWERDHPELIIGLVRHHEGRWRHATSVRLSYEFDVERYTTQHFTRPLLSNGALLEGLLRARTEGEVIRAGGDWVIFRGVGERDSSLEPPDVSAALERLADDYWTHAHQQLSVSTVLDLFEAQEASQALLSAYLSLGLPETMAKNDVVRAVLRGSGTQGGLGGQGLRRDFERRGAAGLAPPDFKVELDTRADLLLRQIEEGLEADAPPEVHAYLEWSLESLRALRAHAFDLAEDDCYAVRTDTALAVDASQGLLANDAAQPGLASLEARVLVPPTRGTLELQPDGAFLYAPEADYVGTDRFEYEVTARWTEDGPGGGALTSEPAVVVLRIRAE